MAEIWKDIENFEGLYQISSKGRIRRITKTGKKKILKQFLDSSIGGYYRVNLCKNGKSTKAKPHQLVAQAFIPNPENKPCIDHINTDRTDNRVENLRWVTRKENSNNPLSIINNIKAQRKMAKPVVQMTSDGLFKQIYRSQYYAGQINNKHQETIYAYCRHKTNDPSGDKWELLENIDFMGDMSIVGRCTFVPLWLQ